MDDKTEFKAFLLDIVFNLTNHDVKAIKFLINGRVRRCRLDKADSLDLLEILGELGFWSWTKRGPSGLDQFAELCRRVQRLDLSNRIMDYASSAHRKYEGRPTWWGSRTKWYGQNGMDKIVRTKWYGQNSTDKMARTRRYR